MKKSNKFGSTEPPPPPPPPSLSSSSSSPSDDNGEEEETQQQQEADYRSSGGGGGAKQRPNPSKKILEALKKGAVKGVAFRELKIKPRKKLLDEWFREGDTGIVFSRRGVGKTWLSWGIARAIALGESLGPWAAGEEAVPVCYLDGEMPAEMMQKREIAFGDACENLFLINHEILFDRTGLVLNLRLPEVQEAITQFCLDIGIKVLFADNLSTLVSGVKENDADAWELLQPWLLDLRRKKISFVLDHHAGRSGEMRGTTKREDSVFWIIKLEEDPDYTEKGCSFIQRFDKERNSPQNRHNHYVWTFKPSDETYDDLSGRIEITFRAASFKSMVLDVILDGVAACTTIAKELEASTSSVSKAAKELAKEGKITINKRRYTLVEEQ